MTVYAPSGTSVAGTTDSATPFRTLIGSGAGAGITTGTAETFIGFQAGQAVTTGLNNTFLGYQAGLNVTTASFNVLIGYQAGASGMAGGFNTYIGYLAGQQTSSGAANTAVGYQAAISLTTGANSTYLGTNAGRTETAGNATTTGSRQVCIGRGTGQNSASQRNDIVAIGYLALVDGDNAIGIGSGVLAGAAGSVAIGKDSAGTSASSTVANEIKLGTALHTLNIIGKTKIAAQARTSGALPTVQLVSTTGAQIDTTADRETVTPVTFNPSAGAAATTLVEISPDNVTYSALGAETEPAGIAFDGTVHLLRFAVPAGWYLRMTTTLAVLGLTTYY